MLAKLTIRNATHAKSNRFPTVYLPVQLASEGVDWIMGDLFDDKCLSISLRESSFALAFSYRLLFSWTVLYSICNLPSKNTLALTPLLLFIHLLLPTSCSRIGINRCFRDMVTCHASRNPSDPETKTFSPILHFVVLLWIQFSSFKH